METIEIPKDTDILERILRALYNEQAERLEPIGILLGPREILEFYVGTTMIQRPIAPDGSLLRPSTFHGIPIHLCRRPGIDFMYDERDASMLAWKLDHENSISSEVKGE
jgi:hypothetical protein